MTLAQTAATYAAAGIPVFPLQVREKKPLPKTRGLHDASTSADQVGGWWRPAPARNIGIPTGARAGFWVFDVDGPEGEAALAALVARHGPLPLTPEQTTGGGRQLLFAWEPDRPEIRNSAGRIGPGLDVRGEGGYIVAPPSVHPGNPSKGVPPGRLYAWVEGRAPIWAGGELALAQAPDWLFTAALPPAPEPARAEGPEDRPQRLAGDSTAYGEAALTAACREISGARAGTQNSTLFWRSASIGRLVAGGQLQRGYAERALSAAGMGMTPAGKPWTRKVVDDTVGRGLDFGEKRPKVPEERRGPQRARLEGARAQPVARAAASPAEIAQAAQDAAGLWAQAAAADCKAFLTWLKLRGLAFVWADAHGPDVEGLLRPEALRAHPRAPLGNGEVGPALLAALRVGAWDPVEAVAVLPLFAGAERFTHFLGETAGRVVHLNWPAASDPGGDQLLVAIDLQDGFSLGQAAAEGDDAMAVVIAPRLSTFAGAPLGDRYGRVNPAQPRLDPDRPPWTADGFDLVYLALRGDLRPPELRARKPAGGTRRVDMDGPASATFWGSLAEQGWRAAGANAVRALRPSGGAMGFNDQNRRAA